MSPKLNEDQIDIQWIPSVATYQDLLSYPQNNLKDGLVCIVRDTDLKYTYDAPTSSWILINISKDQIYNFDIPDINIGEAGSVLVVNTNENGVEYKNTSKLISDNLSTYTKEPTGFINPSSISSSYSTTNRTITLIGDLRAVYKNEVIASFLVNEISTGVYEWTSPAHVENPSSTLFLKFDGTDLTWSTTPWSYNEVQIASVVVITSTSLFAIRETHGLMPWQTHQVLHRSIGTTKISGGEFTNYVLQSSTATERRPNISQVELLDEDLNSILSAFDYTTDKYSIFSLSDSNTINITIDQNEIVPIISNYPAYNSWNGSTWTQTQLVANTSMSVWVMAIPTTSDTISKKYRYLFIQGQSSSGSSSEELVKTPLDLNLGNLLTLVPEFVFIAQIILRRTSAGAGQWYIDAVENILGSRSISIGRLGEFHPSLRADEISYDNTDSTLTSSNVKTSLDELDNKVELNKLIKFATLTKTSNQTISRDSMTAVTWQSESGGLALWNSSQSTRITIPSSISKIRIYVLIKGVSWAASSKHELQIRKNETEIQRILHSWEGISDDDTCIVSSTGILEVSENDWFDIRVLHRNNDLITTTRDISSNLTYLQVEVLE